MFNFNGMPYKRSGRAGGKSVSMIGMLVLLLAALLVLPSCFDGDTETVTVTQTQCDDDTIAAPGDTCPDPVAPEGMYDETGLTMFMGGDLDESVAGSEGDDVLSGGPGDDTLNGMAGDDMINGDEGNDTLMGGPGDDTLMGGDDPGLDTIHGGDGDDTITGGPGADTITGGAGDDMITGGPGADDIDGGAGSDTASYADSEDGVRVDLSDPLDIASFGDAFRDSLRNIENLEGSSAADVLTGNDGDNVLTGGDGDDTLAGGDGDDTLAGGLGNDSLDGGDGNDTADYSASAAGVIVDLAVPSASGEGDDTIATYDHDGDDEEADATAEISTIENVKGSAADVINRLTGNDEDNRLEGGAGGDTLIGGDGNDMLIGGAGGDTLMGGDGNDTLEGGAGNDTLEGGNGDDTYLGVTADDTVTEVPDNANTEDVVEGGTMDTVHYVGVADDPETEDADETMGVTDTAPANVETVLGTENDDILTAHNDGGAAILGREGDDELNGGDGVDTLVGCAGENTLNGGGGDDVFGVFNDGANADEIVDFTDGDEIHLKNFDAGAVITFSAILDNVTHAAVQVDGVTVATVTSAIGAVIAAPDADPPVVGKSKVEAIIDALGEDNDADPAEAVTRTVVFDPAKCSSS